MNNYVAKIQKSFERIKFPGPFSSPLLQNKSKTRLNAGILKLSCLSDLAKGAEVPLTPSLKVVQLTAR